MALRGTWALLCVCMLPPALAHAQDTARGHASPHARAPAPTPPGTSSPRTASELRAAPGLREHSWVRSLWPRRLGRKELTSLPSSARLRWAEQHAAHANEPESLGVLLDLAHGLSQPAQQSEHLARRVVVRALRSRAVRDVVVQQALVQLALSAPHERASWWTQELVIEALCDAALRPEAPKVAAPWKWAAPTQLQPPPPATGTAATASPPRPTGVRAPEPVASPAPLDPLAQPPLLALMSLHKAPALAARVERALTALQQPPAVPERDDDRELEARLRAATWLGSDVLRPRLEALLAPAARPPSTLPAALDYLERLGDRGHEPALRSWSQAPAAAQTRTRDGQSLLTHDALATWARLHPDSASAEVQRAWQQAGDTVPTEGLWRAASAIPSLREAAVQKQLRFARIAPWLTLRRVRSLQPPPANEVWLQLAKQWAAEGHPTAFEALWSLHDLGAHAALAALATQLPGDAASVACAALWQLALAGSQPAREALRALPSRSPEIDAWLQARRTSSTPALGGAPPIDANALSRCALALSLDSPACGHALAAQMPERPTEAQRARLEQVLAQPDLVLRAATLEGLSRSPWPAATARLRRALEQSDEPWLALSLRARKLEPPSPAEAWWGESPALWQRALFAPEAPRRGSVHGLVLALGEGDGARCGWALDRAGQVHSFVSEGPVVWLPTLHDEPWRVQLATCPAAAQKPSAP